MKKTLIIISVCAIIIAGACYYFIPPYLCKHYYEEGEKLLSQKDTIAAKEYFQKAADYDNADAMCELAKFAIADNVNDNDSIKKVAFEMLSNAFQKGNKESAFYLAESYLSGYGTAKDIGLARKYYQEDAGIKNGMSKFRYAQAYANDVWGKANQDTINSLLEDAYNCGSEQAGLSLANRLLLNHKYDRGFRYLKEVADKNNAEAAYFVALGYLGGLNDVVKTDYKLGFKYASQAAKANYAKAFGLLAECYRLGYGTEKSIGKAIEAYEKGASLNDPDAMYVLGNIYFYGQNGICERDVNKGLELLSKSAKLGNKNAQKFIDDRKRQQKQQKRRQSYEEQVREELEYYEMTHPTNYFY